MSAYYRNRETGQVQAHPTPGLGEFFNSDEIGEDGKIVKPFIPLGASSDEAKHLLALAKDENATIEAANKAQADKTTDAKPGTGDKKEGN